MKAGAPKGNKNAEKWTKENAEKLFIQAIELSNEIETQVLKKGEYTITVDVYKYDFIGEVARELKLYKSVFTYLKDTFPELEDYHTQLVETLEANCFCNSKKGAIKEATAIMNLKSNHKWTDRLENNQNVTVNEIPPLKWFKND